MAAPQPDAYVDKLIQEYIQRETRGKPNQISYERTNLQFKTPKWSTEFAPTHDGLKRSVAVEDTSGSSGSVKVSMSGATMTCRIHISGGRFVGRKKLVELPLPDNHVFRNFHSVEIDASREVNEAVQKSTPITVADSTLSGFGQRSVQSRVNIFEGSFECLAVLSGKVITERGEVKISSIVQDAGRLPLPSPFFAGDENSLSWTVKGVVEFILDRHDHVE